MLTWPDGRKYEGPWKNGKQDGVGAFTSAGGQKQKGQWKEGKLVQFFDDNAAVPTSDALLIGK